jgi:hypothetical protein
LPGGDQCDGKQATAVAMRDGPSLRPSTTGSSSTSNAAASSSGLRCPSGPLAARATRWAPCPRGVDPRKGDRPGPGRDHGVEVRPVAIGTHVRGGRREDSIVRPPGLVLSVAVDQLCVLLCGRCYRRSRRGQAVREPCANGAASFGVRWHRSAANVLVNGHVNANEQARKPPNLPSHRRSRRFDSGHLHCRCICHNVLAAQGMF